MALWRSALPLRAEYAGLVALLILLPVGSELYRACPNPTTASKSNAGSGVHG
jgi:hypothetical protein